MNEFPASVEVLIERFRQQPTIGKKTAQRLALHALKDPAATRAFARALLDVTDKVHRCRICGNITEETICPICASAKRDHSVITVVEDVTNLLAIERGATYFGTYHVLDGLLSPMDHRGPEDIGVHRLLQRITDSLKGNEPVTEVILALSPTVEGETTMLFLANQMEAYPVRVSRIASGIPVGGTLEYYDELTLARAMQDRRTMNEE